ncbi:hypothetical protein E0H75_39250 [Kribbella capetownensis]|uniref:WD40 repeat domain-containing protein n=1 Tax=Kribbella capetownensis TaxID=1572659 RepID=A0A4R0J6T6_9ACTN|nr:hypothetical protein [Kribbella capetownensis]TCC40106.1 hypothetical protein E0H75_39250 [Kribbella capetownensis]
MTLLRPLALAAATFFTLGVLPLAPSAAAPSATTASAGATSAGAIATGATSAAAASRAAGSAGVPIADPTPGAPKKLFTIGDPRVEESSGLAKSHNFDDIYWTINDSGDRARVFGIDLSGKVEMVLNFNAEVSDVEAIAVDKDGFIYVADIGDNKADRDMVSIYTMPEPKQRGDVEKMTYHRYDFTYPDGAHDAETLLVEPGTNQLYIVTKATKGAAIYAAPPAPSREGTNELTKFAPAPPGVFTDGVFLSDGQQAVLRTYTDVQTVAWGETPTVVAKGATPLGQGESVALGKTDSTLLVGYDAKDSPVYQVPVPVKKAASPPPATATPKPGTTDDAGTESKKSHSLRWILIGAAAFALLITILTFPPGRRERRDRQAENARLTGQSPPTPHRRT